MQLVHNRSVAHDATTSGGSKKTNWLALLNVSA
jgi:hypothetical protein